MSSGWTDHFSLKRKYQLSSILVTSMSLRIHMLQKQFKGRKIYFRLQFGSVQFLVGKSWWSLWAPRVYFRKREPATLRGTHFLRGSVTSSNSTTSWDQVLKHTKYQKPNSTSIIVFVTMQMECLDFISCVCGKCTLTRV